MQYFLNCSQAFSEKFKITNPIPCTVCIIHICDLGRYNELAFCLKGILCMPYAIVPKGAYTFLQLKMVAELKPGLVLMWTTSNRMHYIVNILRINITCL